MHVLNTFTSGNTLEELDKNSRKGSNFNSRSLVESPILYWKI